MASDCAGAAALLNDARCYDLCVPESTREAVLICLLAEILETLNPGADLTPDGLVEQAQCFQKRIPDGMEGSVANYLLQQILVAILAGGIGGSSTVIWRDAPTVPGHPESEPPPLNHNANVIVFFRNGTQWWAWDAAAQAWS